ncbi:hypothetical protein HA630_08170 [Aquabacterium sp. A08]|nr:hypothetical protein [Aquabacterium sp. A08]
MTQHLQALKQQATATLNRIIPQGLPCALLDFPHYSNVGDSAIWLGEMDYCRSTGKRLRYVASMTSYAEPVLRRAMPHGVVLLQGGGNFGSLWKAHQDHRLEVLHRLRDYKVVQLPQSLFFGDDTACFAQAAQAIQQHPDFTLVVRDQASLELGNQLGARTVLCPDSAVFLAGRLQPQAPQFDCFALTRTDKESTGRDWPQPPTDLTTAHGDWLDEPDHWIAPWLKRLQQRAHGRFGHLYAFQQALLAAFNTVANARLQRGVEQLSQGRVVVTDRLHAHLLSTLLHIPNVVLDNHYGKIHGYMESWDDGINRTCHNVEEVWSHAIAILQSKAPGKSGTYK